MWEDPIVAEVHRTREKLAAEHNYDIDAYFAAARRRQASLGNRLVSGVRPANGEHDGDTRIRSSELVR
jgi:hypothetical protein